MAKKPETKTTAADKAAAQTTKPLLPLLTPIKVGVPASLQKPAVTQTVKGSNTLDNFVYSQSLKLADAKRIAAKATKANAGKTPSTLENAVYQAGLNLAAAKKIAQQQYKPANTKVKPVTKKEDPPAKTKPKSSGKKTTSTKGKSAPSRPTNTADKVDKIVTPDQSIVIGADDGSYTEGATGKTDLFPTPFSAYSVPQNDGSIVPAAKTAGPELLVVSEENYTPEYLQKIMFETLTGVEIIGIARHDEVDGGDLTYSAISNLGKVSTLYGGANLVALQNTSEQLARRYPIDINSYIPTITSDPKGLNRPVYLSSNGSIIIEVKNALFNEEIDIQIISATDDTIY